MVFLIFFSIYIYLEQISYCFLYWSNWATCLRVLWVAHCLKSITMKGLQEVSETNLSMVCLSMAD